MSRGRRLALGNVSCRKRGRKISEKRMWAPVSRGDAHVGVLRMFCVTQIDEIIRKKFHWAWELNINSQKGPSLNARG
jgi:hypothetical protein